MRSLATALGQSAPSTGANRGSVPPVASHRERMLRRLRPMPLGGWWQVTQARPFGAQRLEERIVRRLDATTGQIGRHSPTRIPGSLELANPGRNAALTVDLRRQRRTQQRLVDGLEVRRCGGPESIQRLYGRVWRRCRLRRRIRPGWDEGLAPLRDRRQAAKCEQNCNYRGHRPSAEPLNANQCSLAPAKAGPRTSSVSRIPGNAPEPAKIGRTVWLTQLLR